MIETKEKILDLFDFPLTQQDFFIYETTSCAIYDAEDLIGRLNDQCHLNLSVQDFENTLCQHVKEFHNHYGHQYLEPFFQRIPEAVYKDKNPFVKSLPSPFHKKSYVHYYMLTLANEISHTFLEWLEPKISDELLATELSNTIFSSLIEFFKHSCIKGCSYRCLKNYDKNGYCVFCSSIDVPLACPLKNEISIEDIKQDIFPSHCIRKDL